MAYSSPMFWLELGGDATPSRVVAATTFVDRLLRAAVPQLSEGSLAIRVNFSPMRVAVRCRDIAAKRAAAHVFEVLEAPEQSVEESVAARRIVAELLEAGEALSSVVFRRPWGRSPAALDAHVLGRLRALAARVARQSELLLRGSTIVCSPVLQVRRSGKDKSLKVRLLLDGKEQDVTLADESIAGDFRRAVRAGRAFPVHLAATWVRGEDGLLRVDAKETQATGVDLSWVSPGEDGAAGGC